MPLSPAQCARAAGAYRALLRAQRFTFVGDQRALAAAHHQTRAIFARFVPSSASTATPSLPAAEVDEHIASAFEIASYLRKNVVQGIEQEDGRYALRFTPETERGDNDTIKAPSSTEARVMRPPAPTGNEGVKRRRKPPKVEE